ncbi:Hypothetical protein EHI5A_107940 [Entamoeba histolytica KU27]|uniref:Uncharacterized protein n=1 Tax=Entamoeba histolytica KU27 TaxID=885311 RepID=M2QII4_ENTHI|nr:Hypothetical protein EHI5A_107940 [Entamoeba histolytica KU27]
MEHLEQFNLFNQVIKVLPSFCNALEEAAGIAVDPESKYQISKYRIDITDSDEIAIREYRRLFDELNFIVTENLRIIKRVNEAVELLKRAFTLMEAVQKNEEKEMSVIASTANELALKIVEKETDKYNKEIDKINKEIQFQMQEKRNEFNEKILDIQECIKPVANAVTLSKMETPITSMTSRPKVPVIKRIKKTNCEILNLFSFGLNKPEEDSDIYVVNENVKTFRTWSALKKCNLIYDSSINCYEEFRRSVICRSNLFFINFDDQGNVFGAFVKKQITKINVFVKDKDHFLFSLNANGRIVTPIRFLPKKNQYDCAVTIFAEVSKKEKKNDTRLYQIGSFELGRGSMGIRAIGEKKSDCCHLSQSYEGIQNLTLTGTNHPAEFTTRRVIVVQME